MHSKKTINRIVAVISIVALILFILLAISVLTNMGASTGGRVDAAEVDIQSPTRSSVGSGQVATTVNAGDAEGNEPPISVATVDPASGPAPLNVRFDGSESADPDGDSLSYEWDFEGDGAPDSTDPSPLFTYRYAGVFTAVLTVTDGRGGEATSTVRIEVTNTPPVPVIETPLDSTPFAGGDSLLLNGYAYDAEDGPLSSASLTWEVRQYHADNFSSILDPTSGNDIALNLPSDLDLISATDTFLEIRLTAVDSAGLSATVSRIMLPYADESIVAPKEALALSLCVDPGTGQAPPNCFEVWRDGSTYHADSTSSSYAGALKNVVEDALDDLNSVGGGEIIFQAGDFDLGGDWFEIDDTTDVIFSGQGIDVTILRNNANASTDTEPFDFSRSDRITIRDMTISAGGPFRSTSDAIDFDGGDDNLVERVKIINSRAKGIIFDGKDSVADSGGTADHNIVRDCIIIDVPADGIQLLASRWNTIENCQIADVGSEGIRITKASSRAAQPHKQSTDNVISGHTIDNAGRDGIKITSGDRNLITGNTITNSGNAELGDDGILIVSSSSIDCDDNIIEFNTATDNQAVKTQEYGLHIAHSTCDATVVRDNNFTGNLKGDIRDKGTGTIYTSSDTEPPTQPTNLVATSVTASRVDLSWNESTDNVAVTAYDIYRDGNLLTSIGPAATYQDANVIGDATYAYFVKARDNAGNVSDPSNTVTVTTPPTPISPPGTFNYAPVADAYVNGANPNRNYGSSASLRTDASPDVRSYLRFNMSDLGGYVQSATLRVYADSGSSIGYRVHNVADNTWEESNIIYNNAPVMDGPVVWSGGFSAGQWTEVDVTSLVSGPGILTLALSSSSSTAVRLDSREGANAPELIVETSDTEPPPPPVGGTFTFTPQADAYVYVSKPDNNYGNSSKLRVDASPDKRSYLRFSVSGVTGTITDVALRVYANSGSSKGYGVADVADDSWQESTITYNNAPPVGALIGASGPFGAGTWTSVDMSSLVAGDGVVSIALTGISNTGISLSSSEGSNPPELVIAADSAQISSVHTGPPLDQAAYAQWLHDHGLTPGAEKAAPDADPDGDDLPNSDEFVNSTDPVRADSDGDGLGDLWEVESGLSPLVGVGDDGPAGDPDQDGVANLMEAQTDGDPFYPDALPPEGDRQVFLPLVSGQ